MYSPRLTHHILVLFTMFPRIYYVPVGYDIRSGCTRVLIPQTLYNITRFGTRVTQSISHYTSPRNVAHLGQMICMIYSHFTI